MRHFTNDTMTFSGANELASKIRNYWRSRGHKVRVRVEPVGGDIGNFQVRSDMVGGWPCSGG